jgi:hypothetical protein
MDPDANYLSRLVQDITDAFDGVRLGDGVTIAQARAIDDNLSEVEQLKARSHGAERRWQDISEAELRNHDDVLPFLCREAYRFYIAAYMTWTLRHLGLNDLDDQLNGPTVYSFKIGLPSDIWHADQLRRFDFLDLPQKQAICKYLRYLAGRGYFVHEAERYLSDYWGNYCSDTDVEGGRDPL